MPNQFCRYLSNGYSFNITNNNSVDVRPCCLYKNKIPFDSNLLQTRKLEFESITGWTDNCSACQLLESVGQQSLRQTGPDWINNHESSQDPVALDIHLDNECNAACVTCDRHSSSLWEKEDLKLLKKILMGPRYAHWNNAEIGSHIKFFRKPDFFDRKIYNAICYFHV